MNKHHSGFWIQGAINPAKKGSLHRQLGVPQSKKIPAAKLAAAASGAMGPLAKKRANLAKTLRRMG